MQAVIEIAKAGVSSGLRNAATLVAAAEFELRGFAARNGGGQLLW
jgi:hypothetical protein